MYSPLKCVFSIVKIITMLLWFLTNLFNSISYMFLILTFKVVHILNTELTCWHWSIRKTYQTFFYRFNSYHELNLFERKFNIFFGKLEYKHLLRYAHAINYTFLRVSLVAIKTQSLVHWYFFWLCVWIGLTRFLYLHHKMRDLGPSYDIYDYNPDDNMGIYLTIGPFVLVSWSLWTTVVNSSFVCTMTFFIMVFFFYWLAWLYWYVTTMHSFIYVYVPNFINSILSTNIIILSNYSCILKIALDDWSVKNDGLFISLLNSDLKRLLFWFPWESFFNYITLLSVFYILTLLSIYNTENAYYLVLYLIALVFLFSSTLLLMDLDIFAGLLLLIESVVVLMLFFLIIYLSPNVAFTSKINHWKVWMLLIVICMLLSMFSYVNLGEIYFHTFSNNAVIFDDFYEALNDLFLSDLTGVYVSLYWTNSLLLLIIGVLLLVASIICVVLVSFFTKLRNYNYKSFLDFFDIAKNCYAFIFLRKQNLSKQGRGATSTRIFSKKVYDSTAHAEYKEKQDLFEKNNSTDKR